MVKNSRILASVIVARPPQITRDASPFEAAYFDYKEKLERGAAAVFPQDFYFKKGSLAERRWKEETAARDDAMTQADVSLSQSVQQQQQQQQQEAHVATLAARITPADKSENDTKTLDRALQRNLYLIVKQQGKWQFPQTDLQPNEYLHEAAERHLHEACGNDMDVWFVGRQPVSHYKQAPSRKDATDGTKIFFIKARVYAGQVKPNNNDVKDFAWLTKDELPNYLDNDYYKAVQDSLSDLA
ncbi:39S mitochondrial ribosomal protein L46-domain-containing protein [Gongronella butleri]|nr:39S mitochondrial ribosomal protein L46-domain-containing protein [Gongronella butleri]